MRLPVFVALFAVPVLACGTPMTPAPTPAASPAAPAAAAAPAPAQAPAVITIHAGQLLDGKGGAISNATVVVQGSKILRVDRGAPAGGATYDLATMTVLPGIIDAHVHIAWYFNKDGRYVTTRGPSETAVQSILYGAGNEYATLMGGVTTIQSPGDFVDRDLRDWTAMGKIVGPRILTSLTPFQAARGARAAPESLRAAIRARKDSGADVIKIFASASIRTGGQLDIPAEQINALCDEANKEGMRTMVHAHSAESIELVVNAGCKQIEHGIFATDADLKLMADKGVYFDPQVCLVLENYLQNRDKFKSSINDAGFDAMEKAIPVTTEMFKHAIKTPGLKVLFGTDAVAGAHGRNLEELICRVQRGGQAPMDAIISATSLNAEAMRLSDQIGSITPGLQADIIAVRGNPLTDITTFRDVAFVMKGGTVYKWEGKR